MVGDTRSGPKRPASSGSGGGDVVMMVGGGGNSLVVWMGMPFVRFGASDMFGTGLMEGMCL